MWPQTLQMSKEECRMTLRRLELESYATVIGALRAQGGLTEKKTRLLEDLRSIFHISQDRHRAEARRVANDEQLSTIAENISGPNTWQEWSREGRRAFPLLPRVAPLTALGLIANKLAAEAASENAKLPYPSETGAAAAKEQAETEAETNAARQHGIAERYRNYVVTEDPFKMPDIPVGPRKYQKRSAADNNYVANKKRYLQNDNHYGSPTKNSTLQQQQQYYQPQHQTPHGKHSFPHHVTGSPNSSPTGGGGGANKKATPQSAYVNSKLQQQRFFHYQQQKAKKMAKAPKRREMAVGFPSEGKPKSKAGRKPKKLKELEEQQRLLQQQQMEHQQYQQQPIDVEMQAQQLLDVVESEHLQQMQQSVNMDIDYTIHQPQELPPQHLPYQPASHIDNYSEMKDTVHQVASIMTSMPQIAASKKEAMRHQNKVQLSTGTTHSRLIASSHHQTQMAIVQPQLSPVPTSPGAPVILPSGGNKSTTTPVQKYIVEERQPHTQSSGHQLPAGAVLQASSLTPNAQYMTLPQFSATASKLRGVNTTILPQGTKVTATKKIQPSILSLGGGAGNQSASPVAIYENSPNSNNNNTNSPGQMFSLIDGTNITGSPTNLPATLIQSQQSALSGPTHAPPAIIQLQHNNEGGNVQRQQINASSTATLVTSTQGKVLTTKILPIILSNASANSVGSVNQSATGASQSSGIITKVEPLNHALAANSNAAGTRIIKNLTPSMLSASGLSVGAASGNLNSNNILGASGTVISTLSAGSASGSGVLKTIGGASGGGATILRKQPNILKSSSRLSVPEKPQIISDICLAPAFAGTSTTLTVSNQQAHQQGHMQVHEQNVYHSAAPRQILPTTPLRANVKICHSSNGKVFLQPTNPDGSSRSSITKLQGTGHLSHRILQTAGSNVLTKTGSVSLASSAPGTSQRFQIQKVQIIPASGQGQGGRIPTGTITLSGSNNLAAAGGKNNMTFLSTGPRATGGTPITISKHSLISSASVGNARGITMAKPNVVVINAHKTATGAQLLRSPTRFSAGSGKMGVVTSLANAQITSIAPSASNMSKTHNTLIGRGPAEPVLDNSQIITEDSSQWITQDTPVDIIVDDDDGGGGGGAGMDDVAGIVNSGEAGSSRNDDSRKRISVLESNLIDNENVDGANSGNSSHTSGVVPHATDWEMELDQAATQTQKRPAEKQQSSGEVEEAIVIDDSYEDVIIEEQYEDDSSIMVYETTNRDKDASEKSQSESERNNSVGDMSADVLLIENDSAATPVDGMENSNEKTTNNLLGSFTATDTESQDSTQHAEESGSRNHHENVYSDEKSEQITDYDAIEIKSRFTDSTIEGLEQQQAIELSANNFERTEVEVQAGKEQPIIGLNDAEFASTSKTPGNVVASEDAEAMGGYAETHIASADVEIVEQ